MNSRGSRSKLFQVLHWDFGCVYSGCNQRRALWRNAWKHHGWRLRRPIPSEYWRYGQHWRPGSRTTDHGCEETKTQPWTKNRARGNTSARALLASIKNRARGTSAARASFVTAKTRVRGRPAARAVASFSEKFYAGLSFCALLWAFLLIFYFRFFSILDPLRD